MQIAGGEIKHKLCDLQHFALTLVILIIVVVINFREIQLPQIKLSNLSQSFIGIYTVFQCHHSS